MAAFMALATGLDLEARDGAAKDLHHIAQQVEDRLVAIADIIPALNATSASTSTNPQRPLAAALREVR